MVGVPCRGMRSSKTRHVVTPVYWDTLINIWPRSLAGQTVSTCLNKFIILLIPSCFCCLLVLLKHHFVFHPSLPICEALNEPMVKMQLRNASHLFSQRSQEPWSSNLTFEKVPVLLLQVVRRVRRWSRCPSFLWNCRVSLSSFRRPEKNYLFAFT